MIDEKPCYRCNGKDFDFRPTTFADQTQHIKRVCKSCGSFCGWAKQAATSFRDEMFFLVQDIAKADESGFADLKLRAKRIMDKVPKGEQ